SISKVLPEYLSKWASERVRGGIIVDIYIFIIFKILSI
ncbi:unnamed protein product, partial [Rotaria sp. Silwood1]